MLRTEMMRLKFVILKNATHISGRISKRVIRWSSRVYTNVQSSPCQRSLIWSKVGKCVDLEVGVTIEAVVRAILPQSVSIQIR